MDCLIRTNFNAAIAQNAFLHLHLGCEFSSINHGAGWADVNTRFAYLTGARIDTGQPANMVTVNDLIIHVFEYAFAGEGGR